MQSFNKAKNLLKDVGFEYKVLTLDETTGKPDFQGVQKIAFYGFKDRNEAQEYATAVGGYVSSIFWENGWRLAALATNIAEIFESSPADNDPTYREVTDINDEFVKLKAKIEMAPDFGEVEDLVTYFGEIVEMYETKKIGDTIVLHQDAYHSIINKKEMYLKSSIKTLISAVILDSSRFSE